MEEDFERDRIKRAVASITRTLGAPPQGWYCRTAPSVNTRRPVRMHRGPTTAMRILPECARRHLDRHCGGTCIVDG